MTSQHKRDNAELRRALVGFALGIPAGACAFVVWYLVAASRLAHFEEAHEIASICLGVSVLAIACIPPIVGVMGLVSPDTHTKRGKLLHTSKREAAIWIAVGYGYALLAGLVVR